MKMFLVVAVMVALVFSSSLSIAKDDKPDCEKIVLEQKITIESLKEQVAILSEFVSTLRQARIRGATARASSEYQRYLQEKEK